VDNLTISPDGTLYAAGEHRCVHDVSTLTSISVLPKVFQFLGRMVQNPRENISPSSVIKVSINTGYDAYFGQKYKVEEVRLASALTLRMEGIDVRPH